MSACPMPSGIQIKSTLPSVFTESHIELGLCVLSLTVKHILCRSELLSAKSSTAVRI